MNNLLRPRIWASFLASSGVGPCDVPFRYASEPIPRYRGTVAWWHAHLRGLATGIHEISGLTGWVLLQNKKRLLDLVNREPSLRWRNGYVEHCKISHSKHQISGFQCSVFRFQLLWLYFLTPETSYKSSQSLLTKPSTFDLAQKDQVSRTLMSIPSVIAQAI